MPTVKEYKFLTAKARGFGTPDSDAGPLERREVSAAINQYSRQGWVVREIVATPLRTERVEGGSMSTGGTDSVITVLYSILLEREIRLVRTPRP